jgi:SAM-dependent methyltransferase
MADTEQRFTWEEMRRYWQIHSARSHVSLADDPDGLDNVIHTGAPRWLNEYKAATQKRVYDALLAAVPARPGARALDVGCGAGRWLRRLRAAGFAPTGIDLQPDLIAAVRERHPDFEAHVSAIQDFTAEPFELVSSVTVVQHIPAAEQPRAIAQIAALTQPGGRVLVLENTHDHGIHVWAHDIPGWLRLFEAEGFRLVALRRYDYSPALRAARRIGLRRRPAPVTPAKRVTPESYRMKAAKPPKQRRPPRGVRARVRWELARAGKARNRLRKVGLRRAAVLIDSRLEPVLVKLQPPLPTHHCGFLFERVDRAP